MRPSAIEVLPQPAYATKNGALGLKAENDVLYPNFNVMLCGSSGLLDRYEHFESTPVVGRKFPTAQLAENDRLTAERPVHARPRHRCFRTRRRLLPQAERGLGVELQKDLVDYPGPPERPPGYAWLAHPPAGRRKEGRRCEQTERHRHEHLGDPVAAEEEVGGRGAVWWSL